MKKRLLSALILTSLALGFTSCGGPSIDDVDIAEIKDACGCTDALKMVSDVVLAETEKHASEKELLADPESKKVIEAAEQKSELVMKRCEFELKVDREEFTKCPSFKELEANSEKIRTVMK
jgi:hypothetical protein